MTKLLPNKQAHSGIYVNIVLVCKGYTGMRVKLVKWDFFIFYGSERFRKVVGVTAWKAAAKTGCTVICLPGVQS